MYSPLVTGDKTFLLRGSEDGSIVCAEGGQICQRNDSFPPLQKNITTSKSPATSKAYTLLPVLLSNEGKYPCRPEMSVALQIFSEICTEIYAALLFILSIKYVYFLSCFDSAFNQNVNNYVTLTFCFRGSKFGERDHPFLQNIAC